MKTVREATTEKHAVVSLSNNNTAPCMAALQRLVLLLLGCLQALQAPRLVKEMHASLLGISVFSENFRRHSCARPNIEYSTRTSSAISTDTQIRVCRRRLQTSASSPLHRGRTFSAPCPPYRRGSSWTILLRLLSSRRTPDYLVCRCDDCHFLQPIV
jgi:hypothetical protein